MDYLQKLTNLGIIIYQKQNTEYSILLHSKQCSENEFTYLKGNWLKEDHSPNYAVARILLEVLVGKSSRVNLFQKLTNQKEMVKDLALLKLINDAEEILELDDFKTRIYLIQCPNILEKYQTELNKEEKFVWVPLSQLDKYLPLDELSSLNLQKNLEIPQSNKKQFVFFLCNETKVDTQLYQALYIGTLRRPNQIWKSYRSWEEPLPTEEELKTIQAIIIPGSPLHTQDFKKIPWLEKLINYLRSIIDRKDCPYIYGSCFGAQLLAMVLGGEVKRMEQFKILGIQEIFIDQVFYFLMVYLLKEFFKLPFVQQSQFGQNNKKSVFLAESHMDHISIFPKNANLFGYTNDNQNEIFMWKDKIFAFQAHPEVNNTKMKEWFYDFIDKNIYKNFNKQEIKAAEPTIQKYKESLELKLNNIEILQLVCMFINQEKK